MNDLEKVNGDGTWRRKVSMVPLGVAYPLAPQVSDYSVVPPLFCRAEVGAQEP